MAKTPRMTVADKNPVGMIVDSMLTEAQFQALNGTSWVLADGRSIAGSVYATITGQTTAPDLRGVVRRGKNNGRADGKQNPDGEVAVGTFQDHQFGSHNHGGGDHTHAVWRRLTGSGTGANGATLWHPNPNDGAGARASASAYTADGIGYGDFTDNTGTYGAGTIVSTQGGNETRMKNVTVNVFIKINP